MRMGNRYFRRGFYISYFFLVLFRNESNRNDPAQQHHHTSNIYSHFNGAEIEIVSNGLSRQLKAYTGHYRNLLRRKDFSLLFAKTIDWSDHVGFKMTKETFERIQRKNKFVVHTAHNQTRRQTTFLCTYTEYKHFGLSSRFSISA